MAWVRCCGGGKLSFPLNLFNLSWTPNKPNASVAPYTGHNVDLNLDVKTPEISNNILEVSLYNRNGHDWIRVFVSTDGNTWTELGGTDGSNSYVDGYNNFNFSLNSFNGQQLYIRFVCRSVDNSPSTYIPSTFAKII